MKTLKDTAKVIQLLLGANKPQHQKACALHRCVDLQTNETIYRVSESGLDQLKVLDGMVDQVQMLWHRQGGLSETGKAFLVEHGIDVLKYFTNGKLAQHIKATVFDVDGKPVER